METDYTIEILEASVLEHRQQRYLISLALESYDALSGYVVTVFNVSSNRRVEFYTGLDSFVTYNVDEAHEFYANCLRLPREEKA